ncbi:MAG TPA: portal protein, partial [Conexibacter sp.]|nr:portal protein [Conexibacter sp.]
VDPPLVGPVALRASKTSLLPGDVTYVDTREGMAGLKSIHDVVLNLEHLRADIGEVQYRIQRAFYEDLFLMLARSDDVRGSQPVTAREVDERHEEKLLALGPVLERTNDELLDPLVDRVFAKMVQAGLIPEPPEELLGVNLKVEYISVMAQAQKLVGVVAQDRFIQSALVMIEAFPDVRHKVNVFKVVDVYGDALGVDPGIVNSDDDAAASREQEQKAIAAQQQAEQAKTAAQAMQAAGNTPMEGDTALNRIVANAPQGVM